MDSLQLILEPLASVFEFLLIGSMTTKAWYLVPLVVAISLVYGGTRHETLSEILAHSVRSAIWLAVFLFTIFSIIWLAGFGTEAEALTAIGVHFTLAVMAWTFASMWIAGHAFKTNAVSGLACVLSGGLFALVFGYQNRNQLFFPVMVMVIALVWGSIAAYRSWLSL